MAVVTPRVVSRLRRERARGANTCATLQRPPQGDALTWRSYVGQRHDLFIGLGQPSKTQPAGFKRTLHLPALRVMTFSTDHNRLLAPKAWEGHGACRVGAARREILRHSWAVAVYVEYWSRTLTAGSQLCKECSDAALWCAGQGFSECTPVHHPCTQELPEQVSDVPVRYPLLDRLD